MKQAVKFLVVAAVAVSVSVFVSSTFAETDRSASGGSPKSFPGALLDFATHPLRIFGRGRSHHKSHDGRYHDGFHQGSWGGWGWRGWYPALGFSYVYAPSPYYYNYGYNYPPPAYYPPPVAYSSPPAESYNPPPPEPAAESPQPPVVNRPLLATAADRDSPPLPPTAQWPSQIQRSDQGQSISVADVKALANAGLSDEVILSHIRNSQAVYHLTTAEIIDLKNSGVSEKVIDFMVNTASAHQTEEHPASDTALFATTRSDDFSSSVTVTNDPTVVVRGDIKKLAESVKRLSPGRQRMEIFYTLEGKRLVVSGAEFAYLMAVTDPFSRSNLLETGLQHSFILLPIAEGDQKFLLEEIPANERGRISNLLQSVRPTAS